MRINKNRLVETASALIDVHSFTGDEQRMAELMVRLYEQMGLQVQWQQVEDGRANALGTWSGTGGGKTLAGFLPTLVELSARPRPSIRLP